MCSCGISQLIDKACDSPILFVSYERQDIIDAHVLTKIQPCMLCTCNSIVIFCSFCSSSSWSNVVAQEGACILNTTYCINCSVKISQLLNNHYNHN